MSWRQVILLSSLLAMVLLCMLQEGTSASVGSRPAAGEEAPEGVKEKIFMQESDASNFLKRRGKRSPKSQDEVNAENTQKLRDDELRREYYEEQRNELENFAEEQRDVAQNRSSVPRPRPEEETHRSNCTKSNQLRRVQQKCQ
ncbi:unique cartilage matrix-associated protein isoform X2 [Peromyscus californicus insignis]|uniref:unique cartilage matrix-associated protein isoform X2 n=1 Tax=Peromyscus californicus insignis TaxID=564181 RepID=UPI0022A7AB13|nr:unique cartilage matrix-associated protein isoform X2 [Peromyscus californicus insignis]